MRHLLRISYFMHAQPMGQMKSARPSPWFSFQKCWPMGRAGPGWAGLGRFWPSPFGALIPILFFSLTLQCKGEKLLFRHWNVKEKKRIGIFTYICFSLVICVNNGLLISPKYSQV